MYVLPGPLGRGLFLSFCFCFWATAALGAEIVIPQDDFAPGWKRSGRTSLFIKADLFNHIDGGAELFLEFGFEKLAVQRYVREKFELVLEAYEMESPEAALGIYLMRCGRETAVVGISARHSGEKSQLMILKNKYFVTINNFSGDERNMPAMVSLAEKSLASMAEAPPTKLLDQLPKEARVAHSERLIRGPVALQPFFTFGEGDILSLQGKIFGVLANYQADGQFVSTRLIIGYPDPQQALAVYDNLRANLDPYLKVLTIRPNRIVFQDFKKTYGLVEIKGSRLDIQFNLSSVPKD